jgi:hypothetical protein
MLDIENKFWRLKTDKVIPVLNSLSTKPWRRMGEWMCRATYSWPRHLLEVSGRFHSPPPGEITTPYPFHRRLGGPQSWSGRHGKRKFLTLPGLQLRPFGRPARSQSIYRPGYPDSSNFEGWHYVYNYLWSFSSPFGSDILHRTLPSNNKCQVVPVRHAMRACGEWKYSSTILDLGAR